MAISVYAAAIIAIAALAGVQAATVPDFPEDLPVDGYQLVDSPRPPNWTIDFVQEHGYTIESYTVRTSDNYILTLFRIPGNKKLSNKGGPPVLLRHGFLGSSADWVVLGPQKALAFILADKGFDVWLANARGTNNSIGHTLIPPWRKGYWDWSFDKMGNKDIPAEIDFILTKTRRQSLSFVGFSIGTTAFFTLGATNPGYLSKVNRMVALAPVAYMKHIEGPALKWLAAFADNSEALGRWAGDHGEFIAKPDFVSFVSNKFCKKDKISQKLCSNFLFLLFGFDSEKVNLNLVEKISEFAPEATSLRTVIHIGQLVKSALSQTAVFRQFDYGRVKNFIEYGSYYPPVYNLSKLSIPVHVFMSGNDWFANKIDVIRLVSELPQVKSVKLLPRKNFNHMDFVYAEDAAELFYNDVVQILTMK